MRRTTVLAILSGAVVALLAAAPVQTVATAETAERSGLHATARALSADEVAAGARIEVKYFPTFAEAIAYATGGAVELASDPTPADLSDGVLSGQATLMSSTVIGVDYANAGFDSSGGTLTWWVNDPQGCAGGANWFAPTMPSGWDNRVSSAIAYAGCNTWTHYQLANYGGPSINCTCSTMGAMNNLTSSERWAP